MAKLYASWLGVFAAGWSPTDKNYEGGCITDGAFDTDKFKRFVHQARKYGGAEGMRIFPYECKWVTKPEKMFSPHPWDTERKAWVLGEYNPDYFAALDKIVAILEANRVRLMYSLFDNCQTHRSAAERRMAPWLNNTEGLPDYIKGIEQSKRWVRYIVNRYGNRIDYEICNEYTQIKGSNTADCAKWLAQMADTLLRMDVPPENICWGACPIGVYADGVFTINRDKDLTVQVSRLLSRMKDRNGKLYNDSRTQDRIYCTAHNIGVFPTDRKDEDIAVQCWGDAHTRNALLSDDGQSAGHSKWNSEPDGTWRRGDYDETYHTTLYLLQHDGGKPLKWIIETLPSNTKPSAWKENAQAMADAYRSRYGKFPPNYGTDNPAYNEPAPPIEPTPITPQPDPEPTTCGVRYWYQHLKRLNFKAAWEHLLGKHNSERTK